MKILGYSGGFKKEHIVIDQVKKLTGKKKPKILFIPTAKLDNPEVIAKYKKKGFDVLELIFKKPSKAEVKKKILSTDAIYVHGGLSYYMMRVWKKFDVDKYLIQAGKKGIVLAGFSAGAVCWCNYGVSNTRRVGIRKDGSYYLRNKNGVWTRNTMIRILPFVLCPHYDGEGMLQGGRKKATKHIMKRGGMGIGLENFVYMEINGDKITFVSLDKKAKAYRCYWKQGKYHEENLKGSYSINELAKK